jgi:uncharacterized membrane protein YqjE
VALQRARAPEPHGLFASLRRLGSTLFATLHSRIELLALELDQERVRVTRIVLLGVAALFFLALGAITATIFVIVLFWDSQRLVVIGFLTVLYLAIGGGIFTYVRREAEQGKRLFAASLEELRRDRERFTRH